MFKKLEENLFIIRKIYKNNLGRLIGGLVFLCFFGSCIPAKNLKYFNNLPDSLVVHLPEIKKPQAVIMPDDILEIKIAGANEATTALLNTYSTTPNAASSSS